MKFQAFPNDKPGKPIENLNPSTMTIRSFAVLALLILAGFLGNYFTIPLFFGADFLFGSMAVLLVLYFYGLGWGMFAAVITHSYTYFLWGHPYGFLNFTCEALFVGIFLKRGRGNLLGLVGLFWLFVGMPLAWIEHGLVMHMGTVSTAFIMLKQAINGVFNAMLVSLAVCYLPLGRLFQRLQLPPKVTLRESLFNLLVMMVLLPALLLTILESKHEKERLETGAMSELQSLSANVQFHLRSWYQLHLRGVQELAALAGQSSMTPSAQLQHDAEVLNHSFPDFLTMHVENAEGRSIAFDPLRNERGESTVGLDFSERPWFQEIKAKRQPLVSEVFVGHLAIFSPIVNLCVPVFRENHWLGCATGTLDLKRVQEMLRPYRSDKGAILTLTDPQGRIIASTAPRRTPMQLWDRKKTGLVQPLDALMYLWQPDDKKLPSMSRWKESFYVQETLMGPELPWKLTAEVPVAPLQSVLYTIYVKNLAVMACLTTLALLLSLMVSRGLTRPLTELAQVTANLPEKLSGAASLDWPASSAREVDSLIGNFKSMTKALESNFYKLQVQSDELTQANRGLAQEILERQQAEEALRESEGYLKTILGSIQTGVIVIDAETHEIVDANKVASDLIGITKEKMVGASCHKFICPREKGQCPITDLGQVIDNSERILLDWRGEKVPIIKSVVSVVLHGRKCLLESFIDISERKRTEETLERLRRENELILDSAGEGILGLDLQGRHTFVNPAAGRMLGYKVEELVGRRSHSIWHHTKPDGSPYPAEECQILSSYKDGIIHSVADEVFWRKDGTSFPAEYHSTPIVEKGNLVGAVVIFTDITERKRIEEERRRLEERLRRAEKMEAMGTLAGGVAHDLNNVLGVLVGYSELLLMEIPEGNPLRSHVSNIRQSGHRAAAIIQDLLTLARRGVAVSEVVNLDDVISDCFKTPEFEKLKADHPQVRFKYHPDQDLMNVKGSPVHLSKTIMNLFFNAAEAISDHGEVTIRVENRYLDRPIRGYDDIREGDYVVLSVSDNGNGISSKDIGMIFEPFYTKKVMGRSGTGLGLAVVWGTVKDHGGYIDVRSEEGKGSTFTLYFPVTREEKTKGQPSVSPDLYRGRGESILVVDDVKEQRELAAIMLSRLGYRVNAVSSGEEAVTYLKTNRVDLLVLDMIMAPGIDGLETYERALEINPNHRAILVSGFSETDRVKKAQNLGAGSYVRKPYIIEKIGLAVRRELDR
jgi:PAS domain S-box-containing protein